MIDGQEEYGASEWDVPDEIQKMTYWHHKTHEDEVEVEVDDKTKEFLFNIINLEE